MWSISPDILTALGTWALVVGTLLVMRWQTGQNREINSASSVMALRERFDAPHLRRARRQLAEHLLKEVPEDIVNVEVGAFFELIGTLTRRRVLDDELIWEAFGSWVSAYHYALRHPVDLIGRAREALHDPLLLHDFEWLSGRVAQHDRQHLGRGPGAGEQGLEARAMLAREASLDLAS